LMYRRKIKEKKSKLQEGIKLNIYWEEVAGMSILVRSDGWRRRVKCDVRAARSLCSEATVRLGRHRAGGNGLLGVVWRCCLDVAKQEATDCWAASCGLDVAVTDCWEASNSGETQGRASSGPRVNKIAWSFLVEVSYFALISCIIVGMWSWECDFIFLVWSFLL
jgi:hypothetical protein